MGKVNIGLRGWRFDEDVLGEDGRVRPLATMEPEDRQRILVLADRVHNFGGFTDGDRAAFTADHFGAAELRFVGWDFEDPDVSPEKREKLQWAERLLHWLEGRRDETDVRL